MLLLQFESHLPEKLFANHFGWACLEVSQWRLVSLQRVVSLQLGYQPGQGLAPMAQAIFFFRR